MQSILADFQAKPIPVGFPSPRFLFIPILGNSPPNNQFEVFTILSTCIGHRCASTERRRESVCSIPPKNNVLFHTRSICYDSASMWFINPTTKESTLLACTCTLPVGTLFCCRVYIVRKETSNALIWRIV